MAAVAHFHNVAGVPSPTTLPYVKRVADGAKRVCAKPVVKKHPVDLELIYRFREILDIPKCSIIEHRLFFTIVVMFAGFLRWDDMSPLRRKDFKFTDEGMELCLSRSKTDQFWQGDSVCISKCDALICPVQISLDYFARLGFAPDSSSYVVCRMPAQFLWEIFLSVCHP